MAVTAVDPHVADVMVVAERDRLLARDASLRDPGRAAQGAEKPTEEGHEEHSSEDTHLRECVRAAMERFGAYGPLAIYSSRNLRLEVPSSWMVVTLWLLCSELKSIIT